MLRRIFWIVFTIAAAVSLVPAARADDDSPGTQSPNPPPDLISTAQSTDVILASVLGNEADPFAAQPAQIPPQWGPQEGNNGGTHFTLDFAYANEYVYRGVNHDAVATHGNSLNLLFDGKLEFDLGKYPHPYVELFTNIYDADPVSRFQEVRPILGANWDLRPFDIDLSSINYIYPNRETYNYPEIDLKLTLDDNLIWHTDKPLLSPYVLGAFEYQKYEGWYIETGLKHDFEFEDFGITVTPEVNVAWISGLKQQFVFINNVRDTGWQHFELGVTISYSLNFLLNVSKKFGEFDVKGYGFYDARLSPQITSSNAFWGGMGLGFKY
jgi:hypothetical protein